MLRLEQGYNISITGVTEDVTKGGINFLKCKGAIWQQLVPFGSDKFYLSPQYFSKIMLFGSQEYLEEVKKRVYALGEDGCKDKSVKVKLQEAYVSNFIVPTQRRMMTTLIIIQSDFVKKPFNNGFSLEPMAINYYVSQRPKKVKEIVIKPKAKRGRKKKEEVKVIEEPIIEEVKKEKEVEVKSEEPKEEPISLMDAYFNGNSRY